MKIANKVVTQTILISILLISLTASTLFTLPSALAQETVSTATAVQAPTFLGPASKVLLKGPFKVAAADLIKPGPATAKVSAHTPKFQMPYPTPYPTKSAVGTAAVTPAITFTAPPVVACQPQGPGCDTINSGAGGATTQPHGLNAVDSGASYGLDIEPPDQGLCAGNGYVMEVNNLGELRVFNTALAPISGDITLDNLMGLPSIPASLGGPWSSGGDPSCLYDYDNGGHWFVTEIVSNSSWAQLGPFGGCFVAKEEGCFEGIAVSVSNNPLGAYNIYFMNANYNAAEPGFPYLLNDFAKIGNTRDAFLVFYDEFPLRGGGLGGGFFNGAQEFAFNKKALELGWPVTEPVGTPNPYFNVVIENMGLLPTPSGRCSQVVNTVLGPSPGVYCWYQVIPAQSPDPTQYDNSFGGSGYMLGTLDFLGFFDGIGAGNNRIAVFDWTGLSNLLSYNCSTCNGIRFGTQIFNSVQAYKDEGLNCPASPGAPPLLLGTLTTYCALGAQKAGPIPLGANCQAFGNNSTDTQVSCPEAGLASNNDGFTQVSYADGQIWGAVSTLVNQTYTTPAHSELHLGAAYWVVGTSSFDAHGPFSLTDQGYITASHEDLEFPAIGASNGGNAVATFTLNGNITYKGNAGGFYPSTAFGKLTMTSHGLAGSTIFVADPGQSPQDGFTEYLSNTNTNLFSFAFRPRWGDYSWAIYDSATNTVYFATNYIQSPNCSNSAFLTDPSCGGIRDPQANWGTSINGVTP